MTSVSSLVTLDRLRCEYRVSPLGVDAPRPRLSWILRSDRRGVRQTAYQIQVASSADALQAGNADLWNPGRVNSDASAQIEYAGTLLASRTRCHWRVRVWDERDEATPWSRPATWTMGLLHPADWSARWIALDDPSQPAEDLAVPRYLRHGFSLPSAVRHATLYATALGLYELRLNGHRVGDARLTPEWTHYPARVQYQAYDVTTLLRTGDNVIAALLGNGWYSGHWQHWEPKLKRIYGEQPHLLAQLELEMEDGTVRRVVSDESWTGTTDGPLRFSGLYEGETYDARREIPDWDQPTTTQSTAVWHPVHVAQPVVGRLVWQRSEPIRVIQELAPVAITQPRPGTYVFDLGQNIAGVCRLRLSEPSGTTVTLKHNEVLNPDGTVYMDNLHAGHLSTGDRQIVRYTCRGTPGGETYEPRFTYQGFRYVEVTGLTTPPSPSTLTGLVLHNDFAPAGEFTCSHPGLNRLAENIRWSQRANFIAVPTDCPQRDERCGYSGDANFFMSTAVYQYDVAAFFNKWLVDLCQDSQRSDGGFADHAPDYGKGGSKNVGWADAGVLCPYRIYRTYGDTRVIRDHYPAMKRFVAMLEETARTDVPGLRGPDHVGLGDWLNLGGGASLEVIGTAHFAHTYRVMAEMAAAIGEPADAEHFAARATVVTRAFTDHLILPDGSLKDSSQTGYALAYTMDLVPDGERAAAMSNAFAREIERFNFHLATGFIGTPRLLPALHLAGRDDLAYRLLLNETLPSWLFPVTHGATTVWERWDAWTPEKGFADSGMNSFNHYAFGAVGEYLFRHIAGIAELQPGYRRISIRPVLPPVLQPGLTHAEATFDSIRGPIRSAWRLIPPAQGGGTEFTITIPPNTTATITLPAATPAHLTEGDIPILSSPDVRVISASPSSPSTEVTVEVGSGTFRFVVHQP